MSSKTKNNRATTLMIQGTTSDAGKSTLVTGLCRLFANKNINVAPFKPQNMALNSAVTECCGEIGRAQAVQAKASYLKSNVDFNPILLKPNSETGAQVIIHGKAISDMEAKQYHDYKKVAMDAVVASHKRLSEQYQLIIVEGAGSPAEINLREGDIANMGFAEKVDCPVIIIADIDKGGVFAHLVGTLMLLSQSEQDRVIGFVINRFRGDIKLLESGLTWLENKTNKPVLGVLPYIHHLAIASEDAVITQQNHTEELTNKSVKSNPLIKVNVFVYPRTSNHTDFDALRLNPQIDCQFIYGHDELTFNEHKTMPPCDLIILPGSKNVREDLAFLRSQGWHNDIDRHLRYGGKLMGLCGGFQMLGQIISDPKGVESRKGESKGLGYFAMHTELKAQKTLRNVSGSLTLLGQRADVHGYEIHAGQSVLLNEGNSINLLNSLLEISGQEQGFVSDDGQIAGCYLHGLFDSVQALLLISRWLTKPLTVIVDPNELEERAIANLANTCEQYLAIDKIERLIGF